MSATKNGILERLDRGEVLIGDGGFVFQMEKRGYVTAGPWTPEVCVEHPEAVRELHREFLRSGSDIMQALTFYASDDKLSNRGNKACGSHGGDNINRAACRIAREVAKEGGVLFLGGVSQTPSYLTHRDEKTTKEMFRKQIRVFVEEQVDFLHCEYFEHMEEAKWAVETCKEFNLPVSATMCIGPKGDLHGVSAGDSAVALVKAGADIVGVNCHFDPTTSLETMRLMMEGVRKAGLKAHFMVQPLAYQTPDAGPQGFIDLPEFPFALEPRICTRFEIQRYARAAYEMGIRVIGGCCGFEAYHIRAIAEELSPERGGRLGAASEKHEPWGRGLAMHTKPWVRARARRDYWEHLQPTTGRPYSAALSKPDNWGVTAGDERLKQHENPTTKEELELEFKLAHVSM